MFRRFTARPSRRQFVKSTVSVAVTLPMLPQLAMAQNRQVNVYNWDTYIGETTLDDFASATGINVQYDLYADNSELFARLREGNPGYDVIVPTNDFISRMILAEMIQKLDHSRIPNFKNLAPRFQDGEFDPGRQYSVTYFWGTIGIGYRKSAVSQVPDSWGYVLGDQSGEYAGKISWLSEPSTMIQMALKYLGYPLNSTDMGQLKEAEAVLTRAKKNVRAIAGDNGQDLLLSGEVDLAVEWNGDVAAVIPEDDDISYVLPKEGGLLWQDAFCIPTGAPNVEEAHEFINFILEPEVHAACAETTQFSLPNEAAMKLMPAEYLENEAIFPPEETLANCETAQYLGEEIARFYDEAMTRIRAA